MNTKSTTCPVTPAHGNVIPVKESGSRWGWYCPNAEHDGRLRSHPLGEAPATRAHFTTAEVETGRLSDAGYASRDATYPGMMPGPKSTEVHMDTLEVAHA